MVSIKNIALVAAAATGVAAQRPNGTSICDYYTTALLTNNTAANQKTLLTLLVNTAVIGNYTTNPAPKNAVPGILNPAGTYNGSTVNLVPYFSGALASTNRGGSSGVSVNFLDDGGAVPLTMNMPANGTSSNQYKLLTHLYEYFGVLLGCTMVGTTDFPAYGGSNSQYSVHKFMALNSTQVGYFIQQVALSASSFGVATADITVVGMALGGLFDYKYLPAATVVPAGGAQLQSICITSDCPTAPNANMTGYDTVVMPVAASASNSTSTSTTSAAGSGATNGATNGATGTASQSAASASSTVKSGGSLAGVGAGAVAAGMAALML